MTLNELNRIISEFVQVGFMTAVSYYEPAQDIIRVNEVKKWLKMNCIDYKRFKALVDNGMIRQRRVGNAAKSPLCYSKKEIKQALAVAKVAMLTDF